MNKLFKLTAALITAITLGTPATYAASEPFDLDRLIDAAKKEAPINVYAPSGKIVKTAKLFTEKYGVQATGKKVKSSEMIVREFRANNIQGDVIITGDASTALAQFIPMGIVESWVSPALAKDIPKNYQNPLIVYGSPSVWTYNSELHDSCPISNVWELTDAKWNRHVAISDPLNKGANLDWFNQLETHHDEAMKLAYEKHYGKPLNTTQRSATAAWVKGLAQNSPLPTESDSAAASAVGAHGQKESFVGFISTAKYRDVPKGRLNLAICKGLEPFVGWSSPGYGFMSTKTKSPNAARLFLHFLMTEEGISIQTVDGKVSGNASIPPHPKEASGVQKVYDKVLQYNSGTGLSDFDNRQYWSDLWRTNFTR